MDWKTNPYTIAERLIISIDKEKELSLDVIDARAVKHGIGGHLLDRALELLHKNKSIKQTVKKGTVYYSLAPTKKPYSPPKKPDYPTCEYLDYGQPIPFYDPEFDGPSPVYSLETDLFYKKKNELLKRVADAEKYIRR